MTTSPPDVCDVLIARTGGLAPASIHSLAQEQTWALLQQAADADAARSAASVEVGDLLFAAVPTMADRDLRRAAVRLRRDVHNDRCTARTAADLATLRPALDQATQLSCDEWMRLTTKVAELREQAVRSLADELSGAWRAMLALIRQESMQAALALASPEFVSARLPEGAAPHERAARTVTSYVTRAALKTSPFSFLTTISAVSLAEGPLADGSGRITNGTTPVALELLLAASRVPELARHLAFRVNPSLRRQADGSVLGLSGFRACADGFFCGDDEAQYFSGLAARAVTHVDGEPADLTVWAERLGAAPSAVARLVRTGVLQPVTPWNADAPAPLTELAGALAGGSGHPAYAALDEAAGAERRAATTDAPTRVAAVAGLRSAAARALVAAGAIEPDWLAKAPLVHETVRDSGQDVVAGAHVREDLRQLRGILAGSTVRSRFYEQLVAAFVAQYGPGGVEPDLLTFVLKVVRHPALPSVLIRAVGQDRAREAGGAPDGIGTLAPATATALFQVVAPTGDDVRAGRHLTVVNRVNVGPGALLTRWLVAPGTYEAAGERLAAWVRGLTPHAEPLQTAAWADWAPVQYLDTRLLARLQWPSALPDHAGRAVALSDLALRHDVASGTLQAYRRSDGQPVSFPYLGSIPRHLVGGAHRVVMTLTDPWVVRARVDGEHHTGDVAPEPAHGVVRTERETRGRLVLRRRTWRMPRVLLPVADRGEQPVSYLARLHAWAAERRLPRRFYLRPAAHLPLGHAKPAWVDLANLFSVHAAFRSLTADVSEVEIVEALPDMDEYVATEHGARAVELTAALALGRGA